MNVATLTTAQQSEIERTRELVMRYGWNATSYQIVNPGIKRWFSSDGDAVVGYVRKHRTRVVAGAPICSDEKLDQVLHEWEGACAEANDSVCYFGAAGRIESALKDKQGYSTVSLGAQPVWTPQSWIARVDSDASLRAQLNRARNKGVTVEEWPEELATNNPGLQRCLDEWLQTRGLPPLHFLVEPETLSYLKDRRIFVAVRNGVPVGFSVLSPVPKRNGWLTEQFPRGRGAPNGTVELIIDKAVRTVAAEGADYVTMGLVPLCPNANEPEEEPLWLKALLGWVRAHGRRFYNFNGLQWFKAKFHPESWEPIYAISKENKFTFHTLYAIAEAFSDRPPYVAVAKGLGRAVRQELRWITHR